MMIYVFEATLLSWITLAWVAVQEVVYGVCPIDAVVFYSQAVFMLLLLLCVVVFKLTEYQRIMFTVQFTLFLFYLHLLDQSFNYYALPATASDKTCTNQPHSKAYEHIFFGVKPKELNMVFSSVSLAFLFVHVLLALACYVEKIAEDILWGESVLVLIAVVHLFVGSLDDMAWYAVLLVVVLTCYVLYFLVYLVIYSVKEFQTALLAQVLVMAKTVVLLLLVVTTYIYLVVHTHQWVAWSYIPLSLVVFIMTTIQSLDSLSVLERSDKTAMSHAFVGTGSVFKKIR
jgi:hypothetical protein